MPTGSETRLDKTFKSNWEIQYTRDLELARLAAANAYYEWACYLAQQAAEKAVKTLVFELEIHPPSNLKTHDIRHLSRFIPKKLFNGINRGTFETACAELRSREQPSRYPGIYDNHCPSTFFNEPEARLAISQAETVIDCVRRIENNIST
jgi:HEPN domain-containing protein